MIKVIKPKPKTYMMECPHCDCEFKYELEDITYGYDLEMYVQCPECGKSIRHDYRKKTEVNIFDGTIPV